jgi:membrane protein implicated in regulation of membrane protease activity
MIPHPLFQFEDSELFAGVCMLTRDSIVLWWGIIAGVVGVIAAQADAFPAEWKPYITVLASIVAAVSGKLATSPLPGDKPKG